VDKPHTEFYHSVPKRMSKSQESYVFSFLSWDS
jgi:hypothetical protein